MKERSAPRRSPALPPLRSERLLDQVREQIWYLHYSLRTEQAYVQWVRAFVRFHGTRHPASMGAAEVEAFLTWLAAERRVAVSTHRQALSAIVFLYQKVLGLELPWLAGIGRPQAPRRLPVVLSDGEVAALLAAFASVEHDDEGGDHEPRPHAGASPHIAREPRSPYRIFPCSRATPSSTARATSAS